MARAAPVHAESHSMATLKRITSQPRPRRGSSSRAPISVVSRKGTGGSSSAASDRLPGLDAEHREDNSFKTLNPAAGSGAGDCAGEMDVRP